MFSWHLGKGNGNPLQYSCLGYSMDGGAWQATVHGVAKNWTQPNNFTFTFHFHALEKEMATHSSILAWRIPRVGCRLWGRPESDTTDMTQQQQQQQASSRLLLILLTVLYLLLDYLCSLSIRYFHHVELFMLCPERDKGLSRLSAIY